MTATHTGWNVLPHGPLKALEDSILTVVGTVKMPIGEFERRMTVVRLRHGRLVIFSAIALDETEMRKLEAFGKPAFLLVPGSHHRVDARAWKDRYPSMMVVAAPGAREAVEEVVPVDTSTPEFGDLAVKFITVPGTSANEAALTVFAGGGTTLVLNDILANLHREKGFSGWLQATMGFAAGKPTIPVPEKLTILDDKKALAAQFRQWAALPSLKRIVVSHGDPIEYDPARVLRDVAATLD